MKATGHVDNPEAFPCPPREVREAEPVLILLPGAVQQWQDSGTPVVLTRLVQRGWWLVVRRYRELPIFGNRHIPDVRKCLRLKAKDTAGGKRRRQAGVFALFFSYMPKTEIPPLLHLSGGILRADFPIGNLTSAIVVV